MNSTTTALLPPTVANILKPFAGRKYRPSNIKESADFIKAWCSGCAKDNQFQDTHNNSCTIMSRAHAHRTDEPNYPEQLVFSVEGQPTCTAFESTGCPIRCAQDDTSVMSTDLMIDFETWGKTASAVVRAVALAEFHPATRNIVRQLLIDARQSVDDQLEHGRSTDTDTVDFWSMTKPRLSELMNNSPNSKRIKTTPELAYTIMEFIGEHKYRCVWQRGHFDLPILASLLQSLDISERADDTGRRPLPWNYCQERDVRTLDEVTPKVSPDQPHHPMSDVKAQIRQVSNAICYGNSNRHNGTQHEP